MLERSLVIKRLVLVCVFIGLVFVATLIAVETPVTRGYFNLGETMVYTAALLGGPMVGGVAGGVGSMLADVFLGYTHYAPGTLVIKGVEGLIVGGLYHRLRRLGSREYRIMGVLVGLAAGFYIGVIGYEKYYGETILTLWGKSLALTIPRLIWPALGLVIAVATIVLTLKTKPRVGARILACMTGGVEMVLGYLLYEAYVLGFGLRVASAELPVNLGQAVIGVVVATYLVDALERMGVAPRAPGESHSRVPEGAQSTV